MRLRKIWDDHSIETIVGELLRWGVLLSAFVVFCGGTFYLAHRGTDSAQYHVFHSEPTEFRSIPGVFHAALTLHATGIIQFGLLLLLATPVARVAFSVLGFAVERDRMYVVFTVIVLLILLYSLFGAGLTG